MITAKLTGLAALLISTLLAIAPPDIMDQLYTEDAWKEVKTTEDGIKISEKKIPGISVKAVCVSQEIEIEPGIIASVVEDISNYGSFLHSAGAMQCTLIEKQEASLIGYQHVGIPMISDRSYAFKMFRPDPAGSRVDWQLIPEKELSLKDIPDGLHHDDTVYIDVGVGSWSSEQVSDGVYQVSYRLIMDPGGWIPNGVSDYFNRISVLNIFKDAVAEASKRSRKDDG